MVTANYRIRDLIMEATRNDSNISLVFKDTLRAMINVANQFHVLDNEGKTTAVKAIYASPERSVAKLFQEDNLILPIISVGQTDTSLSYERQKYNPLVVYSTAWDDVSQKAIRIVSLSPKPIDISYEWSVWASYRNDLDQISEQIHSLFNPAVELKNTHSDTTKAFLNKDVNDSRVKLRDREDRLLKRTFLIEVQTYIPSPKFLFTSTGKIIQTNLDIETTEEAIIVD